MLPRLESLVARAAPAGPPALLDLGCGTGALLRTWRRRHPGWALAGVDASAAMLGVARRARRGDRVTWARAGFQGPLPFADDTFTAAGCFFDAMNHAVAPGALAATCAAVARALRPGGLFVFDLNNRHGFECWWHDRRVYATESWTLTMDASFDAGAGLAEGRAVVERTGAPTAFSVVTERCFDEDEVRAALASAGLVPVTIEPWTPMPGDEPGKTWVVARRA